MDLIKRKILLEDSIDRNNNSKNWGQLTADTFYINIILTQNIDDMGQFTDISYISGDTQENIVDYSLLINKLSLSGISFPFMYNTQIPVMTGLTTTDNVTLRLTGNTVSDFYNYLNIPVTGLTDSKINDLQSYDSLDRFKNGLDIDKTQYLNYLGSTINGVSRIVSDNEPKIYVFDTENNQAIGTVNQNTGILYNDFTGNNRTVIINNTPQTIPLTNFKIIGEGNNETNTSLSALTKEEYLFGIISKPEIKNDLFIDRGVTTVIERHLKLCEIKTLSELSRYGNGYYNITRI